MVRLFSHRPHSAWEFTPGEPIWRLHPPVSGHIVGETRNVETKHASYFAVQSDSGRCLWRDREFHDPWWVAIERVSGERLVLHGYAAPDSPVIRGVTVVDVLAGSVVLSDPEWTGNDSLLVEAGVNPADQGIAGTAFPVMYDPQSAQQERNAVLAAWPVEKIVGGIEIADHGTYTIAAAHLLTESAGRETLQQQLKIQDTAGGKVLYEDTIVASAKGIAPDAFFISAIDPLPLSPRERGLGGESSKSSTLYYIRERKTLVAVKI
jgi:hypothetical protein